MQSEEQPKFCIASSWRQHPVSTDNRSQSDRSEQSDVMMPDQHLALEQACECHDAKPAISAAASPKGAAMPVQGSAGTANSTAGDACGAAEVATSSAATDETAAVAKPQRVFKMSDEFLMFKFKIEMCSRKDRHDWKICPYAHPGEVARRRHPRGYTAVLCPAKTAASCPRREQCSFAHNPFEFWLHPDRFKTSLCNQGPTCDRPICFFAHKEDELRRLASGLEAAGPDDYVYATAASTPEPHNTADAPPPPPPPPPRAYSLGSAMGATGLGFLPNNALVAAAAAAAAAAVSLNGANLMLGPGAASPHQLMLLNGEDQLLQAANAGLLPDYSGLANSAWLHSNSDPTLLASGRQLSATSPVPLPHSHSTASSRAFRSQLEVAASMGMMPMSLDAAAAAGLAAGSYGTAALDPNILASTAAGVSLAQRLSSNAASLAGAVNLAGNSKMAGSAPAGYTLLAGADAPGAGYQQQQQQLLQQLQLEQQQLNQRQMMNDQLLLQQALVQQQQQQAAMAASASNAELQQLVKQQQQALQQLQLSSQLQQHPTAVQQPMQQWASSSLLASQPVVSASPSAQLLWQQQQQQQQQLESQFAPSSFRSSGSLTPPDNNQLAAALSASAMAAASGPLTASSAQITGSVQLAGLYPAGSGLLSVPQQNSLKWSSSILSKQVGQVGSGMNGSADGAPAF